jgi:dTDP-4-amino-4,6-dideoxygalactose transaminase
MKEKDLDESTALLSKLNGDDIYPVFHYVPLHRAPANRIFSRFHGNDTFRTNESIRLIRLPIWYGMDKQTGEHIVQRVTKFF